MTKGKYFLLSIFAGALLGAALSSSSLFLKPPLPNTPEPITEEILAYAKDALMGVEGAEAAISSCPADIEASLTRFWHPLAFWQAKWRLKSCEKAPSSCIEHCVTKLNGSACRSVGRVFEVYGDLPDNSDHETGRALAFSLACALSNPSGCTNRAAGIRNAPFQGGPYYDSELQMESCIANSFSIACQKRDPWGCAMLGQAYEYGQGLPADIDKAIASYRRACSISKKPKDNKAESKPCSFAMRKLSKIEASN